MASKLSSILVKLGLIPIRKLDQAFQNQVIHGGTLDSALLELGLIREKDLIRVLVEASGIPSIQPSEIIPENIRELVALFPQKLALRYQVIPVVRLGAKVGVLVNAEFDKNKIDEIGFMLGVGLVARVVPEPRLMHFASVIYGVPLDERQQRILDRIGMNVQYPEAYVRSWAAEDAFAGEPEENAQPDGAPAAGGEKTPIPEFNHYGDAKVSPDVLVSAITRTHQTGEQEKVKTGKMQKVEAPLETGDDENEEDIHQVTTRPGFVLPNAKRHRSPFSESGPIGPLPEAMTSSLSTPPETRQEVRQIQEAAPVETTLPVGAVTEKPFTPENIPDNWHKDTIQTEAVAGNETETDDVVVQPEPVVMDAAPAAEKPATEMPAGEASVQTAPQPVQTAEPEHLVSFDASPLQLNDFSSFLATASHRDDMLVSFLRFCSNYAQYLFLFTVEQEAATGRFAIYRSQLDQHRVRNLYISLSFDSVLKTAAQNIPVFGPYTPSEGNQFLLDYLGLSVPMHIMAIPVSVGSRVVAIVLGTHSLAQSPLAVGDVTAAAGLLGQALLQLIKKRKVTQSSSRKTGSQTADAGSSAAVLPAGVPETIHAAVTVPISGGAGNIDGQAEEIIALIDRLEHLSIQQDQLDMRSAAALMALGERTLEVLRFYFPGILTYRDFVDPALAPPPRAHGPLLEFMVNWGLPVVPVLVDLLDSENPTIRLYAAYLFQEIRFPDILFRIAEKLFDPEPRVRDTAAWVILSYEGHREYAEITSNLRGFLSHPDPALQKNAIEALGRLRDKHAVEPLLALLPEARAHVLDAMILALRKITLRDFGNQVERWTSWWAINASRHRILWLIEGLRQSDDELRRDALRELKRIVGETFDYDPAAPMDQRENAVRRWVTWWDQQGRHRWV